MLGGCAPSLLHKSELKDDDAGLSGIPESVFLRGCSCGHVLLYADIYVAGFPCQPFSLQGRKQGFRDAKGRGKIFFYVRDYIRVNRPKMFVLENVKGLMSVKNGFHFKYILKTLDDIGAYNIHHAVLNTQDHGVPQSRPRIYIVGIRKDVDKGTFSFPGSIPCPSIEEFLDKRTVGLRSEVALVSPRVPL